MAVLTLTLNNVSCYEQETSSSTSTVTYSDKTDNPSLSSEKNEVKLYLNCKDSDTNREFHDYNLSLVEYKFQKKMYQPTEIQAYLQIINASGSTWYSIGRKRIESTFKHKQVKLAVDGNSIGNDFYVHEVIPCYKKDSMVVKLKIYSLDKLLTLDKSCYSYVGKKLGSDILSLYMDNSEKAIDMTSNAFKKVKDRYYFKPYNKNTLLQFNIKNMQMLYFENSKEERVEHMFPYLVQYNESFYDMLIRTCNRWGEFVFWENGKLNIGYDSTKPAKKDSNGNTTSYEYKTIPDKYKTLTFPNIDETSGIAPDNSQYFFPVGADDSTIRDTNAQKSKWESKGQIAQLLTGGNMWDVFLLRQFSQFLGTDKDLLSFLASLGADDVIDWAKEEAAVANKNSSHNDKFFKKPDTTDEQYGKAMFKGKEKDGMNEFTEIGTKYGDKKYKEILKYELKAMENVMEIDYDTTWPGLKLGEIIDKDGETFIVVEVGCEKNSKGSPVFRIKAIGGFNVTDENKNTFFKFFPPMLATGHVRYSGPQKATVQEASSDDPCDQNRVRVAYPWQMKDKDNWVGDLSPRIRIASADGGANMASRFYVGDSVMIGYIDGNIERPYVLGSIPKIGTVMNNVHTMTTPGGHAFNLTDGTGEGLVKLVSNAIVPAYNSVAAWFPSSISSNVSKGLSAWEGNKYFEGGFTLTDRYGIYSISGSSDGRNVSIRSPWGDIFMSSFTGINIMAPNGDINIVGKNVKIAAGNNLTLLSGTNVKNQVLKEDGKDKGDNQWVYCDKTKILTAIVGQLAKKNLKAIDIKFLRSVVEIVMRPVEGTLTLKSMRYMKLEAGMRNKCEFPASAYNKKRESEKEFIESFRSLISGPAIIDIFKQIPAFTDKLLNDLLHRNQAIEKNKFLFDHYITKLKKYANDNTDVCKSYTDLKTAFWDNSAYEAWDETKLDFKENVAKDKDEGADDYRSKVDKHFYYGLYNSIPDIVKKAAFVCGKRAKYRGEVLNCANKLRKAICAALNYEITEDTITNSFQNINDPDEQFGIIAKIQTAISEDKCPNSILYKEYDDEYKKLDSKTKVTEDDKKYLRRLVIYNLLTELGFDKDSRREIKKSFNDKKTTINDPNTADLTRNGDNSLLNDKYWNYYVQSLSGVTIVQDVAEADAGEGAVAGAGAAAGAPGKPGTGESVLNSLLKETGISDTKDALLAKRERNIWSGGKEGGLLFGADETTYELKNHAFTEIEAFKPETVSYTDGSQLLKYSDKRHLIALMKKLRNVLSKQ